MRQKKLMLLGGLRYLIPVIEEAHKLGLYVITCDYLPDNIAHKYSDEYHNVSIIDKEAVLKLARELEIDGIMSFAVDPGVVTAAYVAEQMGLSNVGPYESVCILQDKAKFREFLRQHHFNCPWSYGYSSIETALADASKFFYPAIVKPTDAAGSKGVSRVDSESELPAALEIALKSSLSGNIIIEEFIEKQGETTGSDSFAVDGKLQFVSYDDQIFDETSPNPYTPAGHVWPSSMPLDKQDELTSELQRLLELLHMETSVFNIEARVGANDKVYIMEVSPRGGGNRLSEVLHLATGVNLIENAVRAAVRLPLRTVCQKNMKGAWAIAMVHTGRNGIFNGVEYHSPLRENIVQSDILLSPGSPVRGFQGANDAVGHVIITNADRKLIVKVIKNLNRYAMVLVK